MFESEISHIHSLSGAAEQSRDHFLSLVDEAGFFSGTDSEKLWTESLSDQVESWYCETSSYTESCKYCI